MQFKEFSKEQVFAEIIEDLNEDRLGLFPDHEIRARERELLVLTDGIDNASEAATNDALNLAEYGAVPVALSPPAPTKKTDSFEPPF